MQTTIDKLDFDAHYTVDGWSSGIAFYLCGPVMVRDNDYEWSGIEYEHEFLVKAVMVGDDQVYEIDAADLRKIDEDDYCHVCGQVGCTHDGRERE